MFAKISMNHIAALPPAIVCNAELIKGPVSNHAHATPAYTSMDQGIGVCGI